jgi:hypothetical protein
MQILFCHLSQVLKTSKILVLRPDNNNAHQFAGPNRQTVCFGGIKVPLQTHMANNTHENTLQDSLLLNELIT